MGLKPALSRGIPRETRVLGLVLDLRSTVRSGEKRGLATHIRNFAWLSAGLASGIIHMHNLT